MIKAGPIGVFDSGYGGLTILKDIVKQLPQYDYLYLGDNARAPYGSRSFETVYEYTLQCVNHLFSQGCRLVILACNTASAKALRTIQQKNLPLIDDKLRVLGVIRPTSEIIGTYTKSNHVAVFATSGTVTSQSYITEINNFFPNIIVHQEACPMWVPLVESNEHHSDGADYFITKHINHLLQTAPATDTFLLGCTHYPLLLDKIIKHTPPNIKVVTQGQIVAQSLSNYLARHPEVETVCSKNSSLHFLTTDDAATFEKQAAMFLTQNIVAEHVDLV